MVSRVTSEVGVVSSNLAGRYQLFFYRPGGARARVAEIRCQSTNNGTTNPMRDKNEGMCRGARRRWHRRPRLVQNVA